MDRANLTAGERDVRNLLGKPQPALNTALLRYCEMASHAFDFGIVDAIGHELVVRGEQFEYRRTAEDQVRLVGRQHWRKRPKHQRQGHQELAMPIRVIV